MLGRVVGVVWRLVETALTRRDLTRGKKFEVWSRAKAPKTYFKFDVLVNILVKVDFNPEHSD